MLGLLLRDGVRGQERGEGWGLGARVIRKRGEWGREEKGKGAVSHTLLA
jgi:hypothetical protein